MNYPDLINLYLGRSTINGEEYRLTDHSDGNGVQIDYWNITDKPQPTIEQLEALQLQLEVEEAQKELAMKYITKRQMWIWLFTNKGIKKEQIPAVIESIPDETMRYLAGANYEGTNDFYYGNQFVPIIGTALGLSEEELKTMFDEASAL